VKLYTGRYIRSFKPFPASDASSALARTALSRRSCILRSSASCTHDCSRKHGYRAATVVVDESRANSNLLIVARMLRNAPLGWCPSFDNFQNTLSETCRVSVLYNILFGLELINNRRLSDAVLSFLSTVLGRHNKESKFQKRNLIINKMLYDPKTPYRLGNKNDIPFARMISQSSSTMTSII
jgi:hypothetical protein